jgi:photosystem II stability/assembly factor-like uncharacterized protein
MVLRDRVFIAWMLLGCLFLAGCGSVALAPTATNLPVVQTDSPAPIATATSSWHEVARSTLMGVVGAASYAGFLDAHYGIAVGVDGSIHYTNDSGATWQTANNDSWCLFGLEIVDATHAFTCGNALHYRFTLDGGKNWTAGSNWGDAEPEQCRYLSYIDAQNGWAASPAKMASTADGGKTWHDLKLVPEMSTISNISLLAPGQGYLMDKMGNLFQTLDGGEHWTKISSTFGAAMGYPEYVGLAQDSAPNLAMRFLDQKNAVVAIRLAKYANDGTPLITIMVAETHDGGVTWTSETLLGFTASYFVFLSRDGKTLTLTDRNQNEIVVLQHA